MEETDIQLFAVLDDDFGLGEEAAAELRRRGWPRWFMATLALPYSIPIRSGLSTSHGEALVAHALLAWISTLAFPPVGLLYLLATVGCAAVIGRRERRTKLLPRRARPRQLGR